MNHRSSRLLRAPALAAAAGLALFASACKTAPAKPGGEAADSAAEPTPAAVCDHTGKIAAESMKKDKPETSDEELKTAVKEVVDDCVTTLGAQRAKSPDGYRCMAKCTMAATTGEAVRACVETCPPPPAE